MGGLSRRFSTSSSPPTPSITPRIIEDAEEDPVPLYFLDETGELSAGIETSPRPQPPRRHSMGSSLAVPIPSIAPLKKKKKMQNISSALRKQSGSRPEAASTSSPGKLKKFVRFLDRVEVLPIPANDDSSSDEDLDDDDDDDDMPNKKQKTSDDFNDCLEDLALDEGIASGLGRAGSPRSPNRSPNSSTKDLTAQDLYIQDDYLSVPRVDAWTPPSPPPSWRIPPESLTGRQPHVLDPPRVRSPLRPDEEIDLMAHDYDRDSGCFSCSDCSDGSDTEEHVRPGVSYISPPSSPRPNTFRPPPIRPVIARKMWPHGEVRFEDQWGHRLIPIRSKTSFKFDLWPVEENVAAEGAGGPVRGAWVKGRSGDLRRSRRSI